MPKTLEYAIFIVSLAAVIVSGIVGYEVIKSGEETKQLIQKTNELSTQIYNSTNYEPVFLLPNQKILFEIEDSEQTGRMVNSEESYVLTFDYAGRNDLKIELLNVLFTPYDYKEHCSPFVSPPKLVSFEGNHFVAGEGITNVKLPINLTILIETRKTFQGIEEINRDVYFSQEYRWERNPFSGHPPMSDRIGDFIFLIEIENLNTKKQEEYEISGNLLVPYSNETREKIAHCMFGKQYDPPYNQTLWE